MENLVIREKDVKVKEFSRIVGPPMGNPPLRYIEFALLRLREGEGYRIETEGKECLALLLKGKGKIRIDEKGCDIIERGGVFEEKAYAVYSPPGSSLFIEALRDLEMAFCFAPAVKGSEVIWIRPEDVRVRRVGEGNFYREVHDVLGEEHPAERLLVGETFNPPGNWSSYPPHRHDEHFPPDKIRLEEVYHFRIKPPQGFGMMRIYNDALSLDEPLLICNCDTVIITQGYHPVVAAPGYSLYYLWILAGEERRLIPLTDPNHAWIGRPR